MNYIALEDYKKAWIFRHKDLPVNEADLSEIRPLSDARALQVWQQYISKESSHPEHFAAGDWAVDKSTWQAEQVRWESCWDSEDIELPQEILIHCDWDDQTLVYFCYESEHVIETRWHVFKRNWKNFLFMDNGPLLIGRKRSQVVQFFESGESRLGERPA